MAKTATHSDIFSLLFHENDVWRGHGEPGRTPKVGVQVHERLTLIIQGTDGVDLPNLFWDWKLALSVKAEQNQ